VECHYYGVMFRFGLILIVMSVIVAQDFSREAVPLLADVPQPPLAVSADGKMLLVYELHLTSWTSKLITLLKIETWDGSRQLGTLEGAELSKAIVASGPHKDEPTKISDGLRAVVLFWLAVDEAPRSITHRIKLKLGDNPEPLDFLCAPTPVGRNPIVVLPPLRGERWRALNGPSNETYHRRGLFAIGGLIQIAQRFAIDFVQVDVNGSTHAGDAKENKSYFCYGAEVFAITDATVVAIKDGIPENVPDTEGRAVPMHLDTVTGNYIVLKLGDRRYALYAHLQPGSIRLKPGDRVRRGQRVALLGNSGNSTEPHLHFQVTNGTELLASEGLPFVFDSFYRSGTLIRNEMPLRDWVVRFP
jgi:hypothetical protein